MADDPVFPEFGGLASFVNPSSFDRYINDVAYFIETRSRCIVEPYTSSRDAYQMFLRSLYAVEAGEHTLELWLNLIAHAVRENMRFAVVPSIEAEQYPARHLKMLQEFPSEAVAVCLGLATMRAELNVPMQRCQISMQNVVALVERLGRDTALWLFDQHDLLGSCGDFAITE